MAWVCSGNWRRCNKTFRNLPVELRLSLYGYGCISLAFAHSPPQEILHAIQLVNHHMHHLTYSRDPLLSDAPQEELRRVYLDEELTGELGLRHVLLTRLFSFA